MESNMLAKLMTILTIFTILIVAGTAGYLVSSYFLKSTSTTSSYKILETRDFSCPGMTGFTFKYPVFDGWEVKKIERELEIDECHIYLNQPKNVQLEISPQIIVSIELIPGIPDNDKAKIYSDTSRRSFNAKTFFVNIDISSIPDDFGFSPETFWKTVIESFRGD